ncbi:MAG: hypothetical protein O3A51_09980 [Verrucomicrobia bacterium]|nr:hypothetical protein [Verrucomicrobiota bacterium]
MDDILLGANYSKPMKTLKVVAAVLLCAIASGCAAIHMQDTGEWFSVDKPLHFAACAAISTGTTALILNESSASDGQAIGLGVGAGTAAGLGKEWIDRDIRDTVWSWQDVVWDIRGSIAGATAVAAAD